MRTIEITIGLEPPEARFILDNRHGDLRRRVYLRELFGPAKGWRFSPSSGNLIVTYSISDNPYNTRVSAAIALQALANVQQALTRLSKPN